MDYIDFQVKIGPQGAESQYAVWVRSSSVGEARGVFTPPLTEEQLELFVLKVGLARRGIRRIQSPEWRAARDFGQKLFRALFTDEVRGAYLASHNDAVRAGKGLRVKLTLEAPELTNYPWEFLYDPSSSQFLSLFEDTPLLRYIELSRPVLPLTVSPPLRILAMASSPLDYEQLDLARERHNLAKALEPMTQAGMIEVDWLATPTLDGLRGQLLKRPYHIFHFIGHGGYDENEQDGTLIFENANRYANRVSGERCAVILGNHRTLRLAVLNACEGARTSQQDPFAGTAMTLVRTGNLPAVIAMQFEISDDAAINFASGFYDALAAGRPVDAATSQGRQAIFSNDNDVEWSTPVLYLRAQDGLIFEIDTSHAAEIAASVLAAQAVSEKLAREKLQEERAATERAEEEQRIATAQRATAEQRAAAESPGVARADSPPQTPVAEQASLVRSHPARPDMRLETQKTLAASTTAATVGATPQAVNPSASTDIQPVPTLATGLNRLPTGVLLIASGLFMALGWSMGVCAFYFSILAADAPEKAIRVLVFSLAELLFDAAGVLVLGLAVSRWVKFERISYGILALGWLAGFVFTYLNLTAPGDTLGVGIGLGLCVGAGVAASLWISNRRLDRRVLATVAAGWFIGYFLLAFVTASLYASAETSIWEWIYSLNGTIDYATAFTVQIAISAFLAGLMAPLIGILGMRWQLKRPQAKHDAVSSL